MAGRKKDGKIGVGPKTNILNDVKKDFPDILIKNGGNITDACEEAHICRVTFYTWYKKDIEFKTIIDSPELKKECRRKQAEFYSNCLRTQAPENATAAIYFFNKASDIMKLLHMSPTQMDVVLNEIQTIEQIDMAVNELTKACIEGRLDEKELAQLKDLMELKRKVVETRDVIEEIAKIKERLPSESK